MILPKKALLDAKGYDIPLFSNEYTLKLDLNENIYGPSPKVIEALREISREDIQYYPTYGDLLSKIAEYNNVNMDMILPTNGADEAISYIVNTYIDAEDSILTVYPTFPMSKIYAKSTGCAFKEVKYKEKWVFPIDDFLANIDEKTKLIILTTPNSPTGEVISRENIVKILENAPNSIVLIDETYSTYTENRFTDLVFKYDNALIIRSMSKDFALAGLRLGYIISQKQNIEIIKRIISPFSVNNIAAKAGIAALEDVEYMDFVKKDVQKSKELLEQGLEQYAKAVYKSETNFMLVDFGEKADFIYKRLLNAGIKVKHFEKTPMLENCFRISIPPSHKVNLLLNALESKDLIVFDMDGVIVDTEKSYTMAIKGTYEHFANKEMPLEKIQQAKNLGGLNNDWDATEFLLKQSGFNINKQDIIDKFQELYLGKGATGFILNESLLIEPEIFNKLASEYDLAIFTGRPRLEAEFVLKRWNLEEYFSHVVTMDDVPEGFHKPDTYGLKQIIDIINPKTVYYLGDTPDDMICSFNAGVKGIGVLPPQDKSENLKNILLNNGAALVLNNAREIAALLNGSLKL
ncbi:MAG: aminotransferase class I/II-fold pyridoxal phosphate-dependent enzyme [Ignavibacteriales bacterium]|nr:aminotransferase class I/II-fold pyridoxal phosphate-dependent enzyme [Ignavibacteriales bacterium]